jgi:putative transcriptional regulator
MSAKAKTMAKKKKKSRSVGAAASDDILYRLRELVDTIRSGHKPEERFIVRVVEIPEPTVHTAATVKAIRDRMGVSQAAFAKLVGVSTILVQSWEQGVRVPSPLAGRLLDTIAENPSAWLGTVQRVHSKAIQRAG